MKRPGEVGSEGGGPTSARTDARGSRRCGGEEMATVADATKITEERFGDEEVTDHLGQGSLRRVTGTEASNP